MKHGFVTVAAAVPKITLGDCAANADAILQLAKIAHEQGVALAVFPELCLTGVTCGDLFLQDHLLNEALKALDKVRRGSHNLSCALVVGLPVKAAGRLYNCAVVIRGGEIYGVVPKTNIPCHGDLPQGRYFTSASVPGRPDEITLCGDTVPFDPMAVFTNESAFDSEGQSGLTFGIRISDDLRAAEGGVTELAAAGALVVACPSAEAESIGRPEMRRSVVSLASSRDLCALVYSGAGDGESTTDLVFSGHSVIAERGAVLAELTPFTPTSLITAQLDLGLLEHERVRSRQLPCAADSKAPNYVPMPMREEDTKITRYISPDPFIPTDPAARAERCAYILNIQAQGLKRRLEHTNSNTAVIGISGGLDSTLALLVTCRAFDMLGLDKEDITAVTMPCFGTTERTKSNAYALCGGLGVTLREVDISRSVKSHFEDIGQDEDELDVTYENAQARERTQVLMDIANMEGGMVIGTGDLSELALGWATYNGDHMSMYGVNASVPKTLVRHLVSYCADNTDQPQLRQALLDILDTPVSPELLPPENGEISQKTEDLVGPYRLHDFFIYHVVRHGCSPSKVFTMAKKAFEGIYDSQDIMRWLAVFYRRFFSQQFKRSCMPDGPKVGSVTLSPRGDWIMPSDATAVAWLKEVDPMAL